MAVAPTAARPRGTEPGVQLGSSAVPPGTSFARLMTRAADRRLRASMCPVLPTGQPLSFCLVSRRQPRKKAALDRGRVSLPTYRRNCRGKHFIEVDTTTSLRDAAFRSQEDCGHRIGAGSRCGCLAVFAVELTAGAVEFGASGEHRRSALDDHAIRKTEGAPPGKPLAVVSPDREFAAYRECLMYSDLLAQVGLLPEPRSCPAEKNIAPHRTAVAGTSRGGRSACS